METERTRGRGAVARWNAKKRLRAHEDLEPHHRLARSLSWPHLIALGVGAIVGTGILTLTGVGAAKAGPAVVLTPNPIVELEDLPPHRRDVNRHDP